MTKRADLLRALLILGAILLSGLQAPLCEAQEVDGDGQVAVLVPVVANDVPGAHGTVWQTETWFYNGSPFFIDDFIPDNVCGGFPTICPPPLEPGFLGDLQLNPFDSSAGRILYLPEFAELNMGKTPEQLHFNTRLYEKSRRSQAIGVEIPVVRESEFFEGQAALLAIPAGDDIRSSLRVYDRWGRSGSAVLVEFLDGTGEVVASRMMNPARAADAPGSEEYPLTPGYDAVLDLTTEVPELGTVEMFSIKLTALTEGTSFWAFVSVTDNLSQHVLLVTPQ